MKTEPLYRRPLNPKQLDILHLLYRFRFATTDLLAKALGTPNKNKMNRRLKVLADQEYIARKYEPAYRLKAQHASFCLLPKGIGALKSIKESTYSPSALKSMYKDKTASDQFIEHWLGVFEMYCQLRANYGKSLRFFTKAELVRYEYFPLPRPDAYIRLGNNGAEQQVLIELVESAKPFFAAMTRLKQYKEYAEEGEWEDATKTKMPVVLMVCDTASLEKKLSRYLEHELDDTDEEDLTVKATTKDKITQILEPK